MIIKLSPVRSDLVLTVTKTSDTLAINGKAYDLSRLPDGASLPAEAIGDEFVTSPIERVDGNLIVTLTLPHAADADEQARFPADIVNPPDGPVVLPGLESVEQQVVNGVIDWTQVITAEMKAEAANAHLAATISAEVAQRRVTADAAIAPLQDAVDLEEATDAEIALLKEWKRFRVALNRLPEQEGYPTTIDWPAPPA